MAQGFGFVPSTHMYRTDAHCIALQNTSMRHSPQCTIYASKRDWVTTPWYLASLATCSESRYANPVLARERRVMRTDLWIFPLLRTFFISWLRCTISSRSLGHFPIFDTFFHSTWSSSACSSSTKRSRNGKSNLQYHHVRDRVGERWCSINQQFAQRVDSPALNLAIGTLVIDAKIYANVPKRLP